MPRRTATSSVCYPILGLVFLVAAVGACANGTDKPASTIAKVSTTLPPPPPSAPLTGLPGGPGVDLERRPLAVKIDNSPGAQPQAGLDHADLVYEEVVEGGMTRFMAVFQSEDADPIGPVRSVRPVDIDLARWLADPVLVFSGGAGVVIEEVRRSGLTWLDEDSGVLRDDPDRRAPHDLLTATPAIYAALAGAVQGPPPDMAGFDEAPPAGVTAGQVTIAFSDTETVAWTRVADSGRWVRLRNGSPQTLVGGAPVEVANLVVQTVRMVPTGIVDVAGNPTPGWEVVGSGRVVVVRDGVALEGTWSRDNASVPIRLTDATGADISLRPGETWWSLLPEGRSVTLG